MLETGFFDILAFVFFLAIFYAILRKSKVLGESPVINGIAALALAFFLILYPFLTGFSIVQNLAIFVAQASVWILVVLVAMLLASFFYPNLPKFLAEAMKRRTTLWVMLAIGFTLVITSGFIGVIWAGILGGPGAPSGATPSADITILAAGLIIFVVLLIVAASTVR